MKISIIFALMLSVLMVGCGGSGSSLDPLYPPKVSSSAISSTPVSSTPVSSISSSATVSSTSSSTPVEASSSFQSEISSSSESSSSESSVESSAESSSSETSSDASSSESSSSAASSSLGPIQTGVFLDAAVSNLGYRTQSLDGSTNELGEFNYREGETIVFFIGELEFPAVPVADIITPLDLANTDNPNNPVVINIARLLQSLDSDGDAENGISLSEAAISAARILDFTLAPEIFEQLPAVQSWLQESGGPNQSLVSTEQALAHLQATLDFIYGPGSSSSSSAIASSASSSSSVVESSSSAESSQVQSSNSSVTGGEQSSSSSQETSSSEASSEASSEIAVSSESSVTSSETSTSSVESSVANSEASSSEESSATSSEESSSSAESSVASSEVSSSVESSAISSEDSSSSVESSVASSEASSSAESSSSSEDDVWQGNAYDLFGTSTSIPQGVINLNTDNAVTMTAKGGSINTSNRKFFFAHQPVSGDFVFSARLASVTVANEGAFTVLANNQFRYGLLAVENLNAVASYPDLGRFAEIGIYTATAAPTFTGSRAYKLDVGGSTTQSRTNGTWTVGNYLRIARTGNSIHLSTSVDGEAYTAVNTSSLTDANSNPIGSDWHIGFYAASGADELTLVFDNISLETGSTASSSSSDSSAQSSSSSEVASSSSIASSVESSSSSVESSSSSSVVIIGSSSSAGSETSSSAESSVASSEESSSAESSVVSSEASSSAESSVASSAESSASSSEESSSSEASSSSSSAGIVNTLLPIYEDFDNVVDATSFTTNYKLLATDNQISFYHRLSGAFALAGDVNQALVLSPVRLSLGNTTPAVETTSSDSATTGELDLSEPYRISFCVLDRNSAGNLQVQIDNNTTGGGNSIHSGSTSRIYSQSISGLTVGQRVTINSSLGTPTSFVTLRVDGGGSVTIDDLWIGYQSDTSTEPAAETCIPPAPVAPAAPQVTAGDAELSVTWSAIAGATGYELVYNTIDTIDGATEYANNPVTGTSTTITGLTNDTTYYVFVRAVNTGGFSDYSVSASGTPVISSGGGEEEPSNSVLLLEDFNGATSATFFTVDYKALPENSSLPMYRAISNGSNAQFSNDQLRIVGNTIITIGAENSTNTTSGDIPAGIFDLSKPYKIVFDVIENGTGSGKIQIQIDNNTSSSGTSIHGAGSRIYDVAAASIVAGTVEINNPTKTGGVPVGTTSSHISIRSEGGAKVVVIDNFRVEYIE